MRLKLIFEKDGVVLHPYNDIYEDIKYIPEDTKLMLDASKVNYALFCNIPESVKKIDMMNPEMIFKNVKNHVELENIRKAQIKDSIAHLRLMKWLKENVGKIEMTEA